MDDPAEQAAAQKRIRARVWRELRKVALPDSRFDYDFSSFIADFHQSRDAVERLRARPEYQQTSAIFVAPDNCLELLRRLALGDGKMVLVTTYALRRGFVLLDPDVIHASSFQYASTLDGMEKVGTPISLADVRRRFEARIELMVTGAGAINGTGMRCGKGHGFFDLEWAVLLSIGAARMTTRCVAIVHDCQLVDKEWMPNVWDTACDLVITPTRVIEVKAALKPDKSIGILWERLEDLDDLSLFKELRLLMADSHSVAQTTLRAERLVQD